MITRIYAHTSKFVVQGLIFTLILTLFACPLYAQVEDETNKAEVETPEAIEDEKESVETTLSLDIIKVNENIVFMVLVRQKEGKKFLPLGGQVVEFYDGNEKLLGTVITNIRGKAKYITEANENQTPVSSYFAKLLPSDRVEKELIEEAELLPSKMTMELAEDGGVRIAIVTIKQVDDKGNFIPLVDAECNLYVQRLFGLLPIAEEGLTTDEDGVVTFEVSDEIKGDTMGNITIVARVADSDEIGTVEAHQTINWGIPLGPNDFYDQRQLWSARSNAPIPLIVVVNAMLVFIWGVMIYVALKIFRIHKLGKCIKESTT